MLLVMALIEGKLTNMVMFFCFIAKLVEVYIEVWSLSTLAIAELVCMKTATIKTIRGLNCTAHTSTPCNMVQNIVK